MSHCQVEERRRQRGDGRAGCAGGHRGPSRASPQRSIECPGLWVCPGFRPQGDTAVAPPGGEGARGPVRPELRAKTSVGSVQRTVIVDSDSRFFSLADVSVFFVYWSPVRQGFLK